MQYMLLIYADPSTPQLDQAEEGALYQAYQEWSKDLRASGKLVAGDPLAPTTSATTVRERDGKVTIIDGPFAETKEWLGGFCIIEVPSLDDALDVAKKCPGSKYGSLEIRPIVNM